MGNRRIVVAFLVAPLVTPLVLEFFARRDGTSMPFAVVVVAYLATVIFGIPAFLMYRALKWTNVALFILGGALIGFIVTLFVFESYTVEYFLQFLDVRVWCVVAGGLSALVFRIILFGLSFNASPQSVNGET